MIDITDICMEKTDLCPADIARLQTLAEALQYVSDLNSCDAFIDCLDRDGVAFVLAESNPRFFASRYQGSVIGEKALEENEPAVYHCFARGVPVHDTRAVTQECMTVQQDVTPIENAAGRVIGVMICERDVSREANLERKLGASERGRQALFRQVIAAETSQTTPDKASVYAREAYHRIKNDLQMLVSLCNVRMRQAQQEETRQRLYEISQLLMAVASLHDVLTVWEAKEENATVSLPVFLSEVFRRIRALMPQDRSITVTEHCDTIDARPERAMTVALILVELTTNAINHAFPTGTGTVAVSVHADASRCSAVVTDDGAGIHGNLQHSRGLGIVSSLVQDKLEGTFSIASGETGTAASFTFLP